MIKTYISLSLRYLYLLKVYDKFKFYATRARNLAKNRRFVELNPSFAIPPDHLIYDSFPLDYQYYFDEGRNNAGLYTFLVGKHKKLKQAKILEWNCGTGRVIRHLPEILKDSGCQFYATDFHAGNIAWNKRKLSGIQFLQTELKPTLAFENEYFDVIYTVLGLTHLSPELQSAWLVELNRVLKRGGVMLFTTKGAGYFERLTAKEKAKFMDGQIVVRGNVKNGDKNYQTYQPKKYMYRLFGKLNVVDFLRGKDEKKIQDIWIVKKES